MKIYQVGGCVRDFLLGKKIKDRDWLVVGSSPQEMIDLGFKPVGKDFPVFLHPQTHEEYALARVERKKENMRGHGDFTFYYATDVKVEDDLLRRDLTINAIAIDENHKIIDPYGGQKDLANKVFRQVSSAFAEDPLRIMRVARFSSQLPEFSLSDELTQLMEQMVENNDLQHLSIERIWQEILRGLEEAAPINMIHNLDKIGALAKILPELTALKNILQSLPWHNEDAFEHSLLTLIAITELTKDITNKQNKAQIRFAALCHDLGKALTPKSDLPHHPQHHLRGVELINNIANRLKIPNHFSQAAIIACRWHDIVFDIYNNPQDEELYFLLFNGVDLWRRPQQFAELMLIVNADYQGRPGYFTKNFVFLKKLKEIANEVGKDFKDENITDKQSREKIIRQRIKKAIMC